MGIKRHGDPDGKPKKRPKGKVKEDWRTGKAADDYRVDYLPGHYKKKRGKDGRLVEKDGPAKVGVGRRRGQRYEDSVDGVEKAQEIQHKHRKAQKERMAGRKNRKRLKKRGVSFIDALDS